MKERKKLISKQGRKIEGLYFYNVPEHLQEALETLAGVPENDLEGNILALKWAGIPDEVLKKSLTKKISTGEEWFSEQEIERALRHLQDMGFIDEEGLITERGVEALKTLVLTRGR
ncbi:MAG: hypothetical protein QME61_00415 [Patescibacteria group bacterium]|nr:hypothetical protein [Patescibacteria group bacterium]